MVLSVWPGLGIRQSNLTSLLKEGHVMTSSKELLSSRDLIQVPSQTPSANRFALRRALILFFSDGVWCIYIYI